MLKATDFKFDSDGRLILDRDNMNLSRNKLRWTEDDLFTLKIMAALLNEVTRGRCYVIAKMLQRSEGSIRNALLRLPKTPLTVLPSPAFFFEHVRAVPLISVQSVTQFEYLLSTIGEVSLMSRK